MFYLFAAEFLVLLHFGFILFVVLGALLTLRWRWVALLHIPTVIWGAAIEFLSFTCPLTPMEKNLRQLAGDIGYKGGFLDHYLGPILYPGGLTETIQITLGLTVIVINIILYGVVILRHRHTRPKRN